MPKPLPALTAVLGLCVALAVAQEVPPAPATPQIPTKEKAPDEIKPAPKRADEQGAPKPTPRPVAPKPASAANAAPEPASVAAPMPKPKKRSFFQRLFGLGARKSTPAPATPTPAPTLRPRKPTHKPTATPAREEVRPSSDKPGAQENDTPKLNKPAPPLKTDKPAPVVKPGKTMPVPKPEASVSATPSPGTKKPPTKPSAPGAASRSRPLVEPPAGDDADVKEKYRFEQAKLKASEDPQVRSLKAKADDAATEEESRKALRAYNRALYEKMRKIDSGLSERIDRMEAAMLKRLNE